MPLVPQWVEQERSERDGADNACKRIARTVSLATPHGAHLLQKVNASWRLIGEQECGHSACTDARGVACACLCVTAQLFC